MTPKQAIFYGEYIKDLNGAEAARRMGVSEKSAAVFASRMLRNDKVSAAIEAWKQRGCAKQELTAELVLAKIVAVLRLDPKNLYDSAGNRIPVYLLDEVSRASIVAIEDETQEVQGEAADDNAKPRVVKRNQKVKFADGLRAAELGGKYLKLFTDRVEHDGRVTLEQLVTGAGDGEAAA